MAQRLVEDGVVGSFLFFGIFTERTVQIHIIQFFLY